MKRCHPTPTNESITASIDLFQLCPDFALIDGTSVARHGMLSFFSLAGLNGVTGLASLITEEQITEEAVCSAVCCLYPLVKQQVVCSVCSQRGLL